jgi:flavodoxin I
MKTLIVYDSVYGNTEKVAQAIAEAIGGEVKLARVGELDLSELKALDLLIVGAPTHAARPSPATREFLERIEARALKGVKVAGFDTRLTNTWAKMFGFAARGIANGLKKKGGTLVVPPEPFYVDGSEGPLSEGELERAAAWGKEIVRRAG